MRFFPLLLLFLVSCSLFTSRKTIDESKISPFAKMKLEEAREFLKQNKPREAIAKLAELPDEKIGPIEKTLKYNLKGVTLFNMGEVEKALLNFEVAEKYSPEETHLFAQIQLNMASGFFKLNQLNEFKTHLDLIDSKLLSKSENNKYAQLLLAYGTRKENHLIITSASLMLMSSLKTIAEVTKSNYYQKLTESFSKLNPGQKIEILEKFGDAKNMAVAQMGIIEAEDRYVSGDKSGVSDILDWLRSEYRDVDEISQVLSDFGFRLENSSRIDLSKIGIVLPLTGDKASFGQKALTGIDAGLKIFGLSNDVKIYSKDSVNSPALAAQSVLELIREEKVSMIIGGLFPDCAKAEYLEARKYGVLYISLFQINLPKEEKNHHLIEVEGSIESLVETLLSNQMVNNFGSKMGVIFPDNEAGKSYIDEIWRKAGKKNIEITSIADFPKKTHDYRNTAQLFLGLKYPRERAEELKILDDVYSVEKTTIRRVQTLPPVIDFDWVFLATSPPEAIQLIPTLGYYDANRLKVIGGPSWVSSSMAREQKNLGTLYFVGDDPKDINQQLLNKFQELYSKPASLIEVHALDAMKLASEVLRISDNASNRDRFDSMLKTAGTLKGLSTEWNFKESIWLKKMNPMIINRNGISKLFKGESSGI